MPGVAGTWKDLTDNVNLAGGEPHHAGAQHRRGDHRRGARRPVAQDHGGRERRNSRTERHHQHDGGPAQRLRGRSDARGARGGYRRQARRPGQRAGRRWHLEGLDRQRQLHGLEPHGAGSQHRRGRDRDRQRRPVEEDHRGRARRTPAAERDAQHDDRPVALVRGRSDARGARSRHRGPPRRPGQRARRRRHVERSDRQRQSARRRTSPRRSATSPK